MEDTNAGNSERNEQTKIVIPKQTLPKKTKEEGSDSDFFKDDNEGNQSFSSNNKEDEKDFNLKSTIAHLQGDLVYSIGVLISAVIINLFPNLRFFDSICTLLFSYVAFELTVPIFTESIRILLEGTPEGRQGIE